jgi:hypothetical protein
MNLDLIDKFFGMVSAAAGFLDHAEKLSIVRAVRTLYFFPDELLRHLDELIDSDGENAEAAIAGGARYAKTREDADQALDIITSESLVGNLKIPLEVVEELRRVADYKIGVRGLLHAIFFTWYFERDSVKVVEIAKEARDQIRLLNSRILTLEKALL